MSTIVIVFGIHVCLFFYEVVNPIAVKLCYNEQILKSIGYFSTQIDPVITNPGYTEKMAVPELFVIAEFECTSYSLGHRKIKRHKKVRPRKDIKKVENV